MGHMRPRSLAASSELRRGRILVGAEQVLAPRGGVHEGADHARVEDVRQGHLLVVGGREGGRDLCRDPVPQLLGLGPPDLLEEVVQQPAARAPVHVQRRGAVDHERPGRQAAVHVDLLREAGVAVDAELRPPLVRRELHAGEDLADQLAAADGVEGDGGLGLDEGVREALDEARRRLVHHVLGPQVLEQFRVAWALRLVDDVHHRHRVLQAELVQHAPRRGGGRGEREGRVSLPAHGLQHPEGGQRVDEPVRGLGGGDAVGHRLAGGVPEDSVLAVHLAADDANGLPQQGLGFVGVACFDNYARALVPCGHRLVDAPLQRAHLLRGDLGPEHRPWQALHGTQVGVREHQVHVGGVEGRRLHAHDHLVVLRLRDGHLRQGHLQCAVPAAAPLHRAPELQHGRL
mmetsp:Transcript_81617/g.231323  ORF Transcript_81617/g.231323 Transcript_81617/m.231323 type:complete len:402 (+) Transcript_81617:325-1530(+)